MPSNIPGLHVINLKISTLPRALQCADCLCFVGQQVTGRRSDQIKKEELSYPLS